MRKNVLDGVVVFLALAGLAGLGVAGGGVVALGTKVGELEDRAAALEAGLAMAEATMDVMAETDNELIDQGFMLVELIDKRAELVDERFGPMATTWWAQNCFGKGPGELPRTGYDACIVVYEWMAEAEIGPFVGTEQ